MVDATAFKTRARTIDHLGREQIADCPTAISELWKNAFDAYARRVELHIIDGEIPTAALVDNGHGMSRDEFEEKWLTVGTESKSTNSVVPEEDRGGIQQRPKQGQKGIGRLSCAALGSLLLIVSKRLNAPFTAALIDWRLFENPFLMLGDIKVPVVDFKQKDELNKLLPEMFDTLMGNVWGNGDDAGRDARLEAAWAGYEALEAEQGQESTKAKIENTVVNTFFDERHFSSWEAWKDQSSSGTALFMAGIHDDLNAQLSAGSNEDLDASEKRARERLFQTLSNFTDPFAVGSDSDDILFQTAVYGWNGSLCRPILDDVREFDLSNLEGLEHIVDGQVDDAGIFTGRVKVFGEWRDDIRIRPPKTHKSRKDTRFGPFSIRMGSYEGNYRSSTHSKEEHSAYEALAEKYSGLMIYRDRLRVMPYGREDNDYFEIEKRRSINAGRYFWSNRRLFGRVAIARENNPNLRDKAGREGLIDNKASKLFRDIVEYILIETARKFFGTDSDDRKDSLEDIQAKKAEEKAQQDKRKWLSSERRRVKSLIKKNVDRLASLQETVEGLAVEAAAGNSINSKSATQELKHVLADHSATLKEYSLSPVPPNLGSIESDYRDYRRIENRIQSLLADLHTTANKALEKFFPKSAAEVLQVELQRNAAHLHARIRKMANEGRKLISTELTSFNALVEEQNKAYHLKTSSIVEDLENGDLELSEALHRLDYEYQKQDLDNIQKLRPYISALQSLKEQIDIEGLAAHSVKEGIELKKEAERLNALAQLGITVEIIGHEIEGLDMTIARGLKALPEEIKGSAPFKDVVFAHQGLSDRWRFLSPLKLSGERTKVRITGEMILAYIRNFFGNNIEKAGIELTATDAFNRFSIYEQPARIYPVFINLVNNSRYWVKSDDRQSMRIILSVKNNSVVVSDTGPGVDEEDYSHLFTLFFTRKERGGRGVGLYLCRTNLQAGGHKIRYETVEEERLLAGANFVIEFKDANYE